jgi:hypothetical protein
VRPQDMSTEDDREKRREESSEWHRARKTTGGGTIARRSLFHSPPKWTGGQNRERDPYKRSSGADRFALLLSGAGLRRMWRSR